MLQSRLFIKSVHPRFDDPALLYSKSTENISCEEEQRMILDARVRPPFKSLKEVLAPAPGARPSARRSPLVSGYERPQSMVQKSVELFLKEMDEAGVDKGILVGRQPFW